MNIATRLKHLCGGCSGRAISSASNPSFSKENNKVQNGAARPPEPAGIIFESLEPRLLLSADLLPVHGSIDTSGETDKFTFSLTEHTKLYFDSLENSQLTWSLTGPGGTEGSDLSFANSDAAAGLPLLDLVAGDYTLTVGGSADATGSYSFRLLDLAAAQPITTTGQPFSGNLPSGRETMLYSFDAQAGERLFFDWQNGSSSASWRLIDPFGDQVWSQGVSDRDVETIALSGTYTLAVEGYIYNTSPLAFTFAIQKVTDTTASMTVGSVTNDEISHTGQQNIFTFNLAAAGRFYFDSLTNNSSLRWSLAGPRGEEVDTRAFTNSDWANFPSSPVLDLAAGSYTLTVDGFSDDIGSYSFRLLDLAAAQQITRGDPISGTFASGNETTLYRFDAQSGDQILLVRQALSADSPFWRLIDPYGGQIYSGFFNDSPSLTLRLTGVYTLLVEGQVGATGALPYSFSVTSQGHVDLPAPTGTALILGETRTGDISAAGEQDNYVFDVTQPKQLIFDALSNTPGLIWSLIGPQGEIVPSRSFTSSDGGSVSDALLLKVPGIYQLRVQGSASAIGSYSFRLLDLAAAQQIATTGQPVSGSLPSGRETVLYRFDVQAGERYFFDWQNGTSSANLRLIDPFGKQVWSQGFSDRDAETLALSGTYTLAVEGYISNPSPLAFTFAVQKVTDTTAPMTVGSVTNGEISHTGQQNIFTFNLATAGRFYFDSLTNNSNLRWSLAGPRGQALDLQSRTFTNSDAGSNTPILDLVAGTYTLTVDGSGDTTGSYSFRLLDLAAAQPIATTGQPVSGSLPSGRETVLYRFEAQAGDRYFFDWQNGTSSANLRLIDPFGKTVWSQGFSDRDVETLALSGTYTLAVEGYISNPSPLAFTFAIQKVMDTTASMTVGSVTNGEIAHTGQHNSFTFNLGTAGRFYFDSLTNNSNLRWSLAGPRGETLDLQSRAFTNSDAGSNTPILDLVAGTYTLTVDGSGEATGSYSFRLLDLAAAQQIATTGQPVSGSLPSGRETVLYRFDVEAGDRYFFDWQNGTSSANLRLIDPFGKTVWSQGFSDRDVETLALSGTYTLAVEGYISNPSPLAFTFAIQKVTDTMATMTVGSVTNGEVAHAGQQNIFTFNLAAAGRFYFDSLTNNSSLRWSLAGPRGEEVDTRAFTNSDASSNNPILELVSGAYTLTVDGSGDAIGSYHFRLLDLAAAQQITRGDPISGTFASGNETTLYRFDAQAGDQILLDRQALSAGSPFWRLIDPYGGQVYSGFFNDSPSLTLRLTGEYTLSIEGQIGATGALQYSFAVTSQGHVDLPAPTGVALILGETRTGDISAEGEQDNYVFDVT